MSVISVPNPNVTPGAPPHALVLRVGRRSSAVGRPTAPRPAPDAPLPLRASRKVSHLRWPEVSYFRWPLPGGRASHYDGRAPTGCPAPRELSPSNAPAVRRPGGAYPPWNHRARADVRCPGAILHGARKRPSTSDAPLPPRPVATPWPPGRRALLLRDALRRPAPANRGLPWRERMTHPPIRAAASSGQRA